MRFQKITIIIITNRSRSIDRDLFSFFKNDALIGRLRIGRSARILHTLYEGTYLRIIYGQAIEINKIKARVQLAARCPALYLT